MSILNYVLADKEKKEKLREGYADVLKHSNTYKLGAGIGNLAGDAVTGVRDFASDITFNPLPYGDMANSAYEGIQNIYGNWLDDKYDAVADWYNPQPDMMAGGPMSRNGRATVALPMDEPHPYTFDPKGVIPSHEIPGYDRMVNEGYDSWSPSDSTRSLGDALPYMTGVLAQEERQLDKEATRSFSRGWEQGIQDTRSDWQKWKDSFKKDWEAK